MARAADIPGIRPDATFGEAAASAILVRAGEVFAFTHSVLDTDDIEAVHDMRVATRRLRAAMEVYAPALPTKTFSSALREVKALADDLGARRDPDVAIEELQRIEEALPEDDRLGVDHLVEALRRRQEHANAALAARLRELESSRLEERLAALAQMARGSRRVGA
jgi:CHAD domain-containing protein